MGVVEQAAATLYLVVGSTKPLEVELVDEHGNPESLAGADRASVTVRRSIGDTSSPVLQLDTQAMPATLSIEAGGILRGTMSQVQADALSPGLYVASAAVRYGSAADWHETDLFHVDIRAAVAVRP